MQTGIAVVFELGLQTVNYHSLVNVNRGHTLAEFIDAVLRTKARRFDICAHVILDLPWDNMTDAIENAKCCLRLGSIRLTSSLYIVKVRQWPKAIKGQNSAGFNGRVYSQGLLHF